MSDGTVEGEVSVLLVHVVSSRSGVVSEPDSVVLDVGVLLFENFVDGKNLTSGLLQLVDLVKEIPETRLDGNLIMYR